MNSLKRMSTQDEEELSLALIKQLEEEEKSLQQKNQDRKKKEEEDNAEAVCKICLCSLFDEKFTPLENCSDMFHETCLSDYLKTEIGCDSKFY